MARAFPALLLAALLPPLGAAEWTFDLGAMKPDQPPPGFRGAVFGQGQPGDWRVLLDDVPPLLPPLGANVPANTKRAVIAQLARDRTDEHFPLLIYESENFTDFTVTVRFKLVAGEVEQMAGLAFRLLDERNFYVIRASGPGRNVRFYKVVNGERGPAIGDAAEVPRGVWHELQIECRGNQIRCWLNGKEAMPPLTDNTFTRGRIALFTKSDSVSYFSDLKLSYRPQVRPAQTWVNELMAQYSRLQGIKVYAAPGDPPAPQIIASSDRKEVGTPASANERECLKSGAIFYATEKRQVSVLMPLRDRNGDVVAAARVVMTPVFGQTEQNAFARARPVIAKLQARLQTAADLYE